MKKDLAQNQTLSSFAISVSRGVYFGATTQRIIIDKYGPKLGLAFLTASGAYGAIAHGAEYAAPYFAKFAVPTLAALGLSSVFSGAAQAIAKKTHSLFGGKKLPKDEYKVPMLTDYLSFASHLAYQVSFVVLSRQISNLISPYIY